MASIVEMLDEMREILVREGRSADADRLAAILATDQSGAFPEAVTAPEIWGGSGSVVDAVLNDPIDDRRFNELIVDLAEALDLVGIGTPRTRWVGQIIEDWLIAHPI